MNTSLRAGVLGLFLGALAVSGQEASVEPGPDGSVLVQVAYADRPEVTVLRDLVYARYGERELRLDLYRPADRLGEPGLPAESAKAIPAVLVIRGGGWRMGDKEAFAPIAARLAASGLAAVCIEYRTSSEARYPAAANDVKAAVRWLRANAVQYGIDPERLGAIGGSAGGHLAAMLATTHRVDELDGEGGNPDVSNRVQAVVAMAPAVDLVGFAADGRAPGDSPAALEAFLGSSFGDNPELWAEASPITYVHPGAAPILLLHSAADLTVPIRQSQALAERYREAVAPVELVTLVGAPHAFWNWTLWFDDVMDRSIAFFQLYLGER